MHIRKEERSKISHLSFYFWKLEKEDKVFQLKQKKRNSKKWSRNQCDWCRKVITENQNQKLCFWKYQYIDKPLARLTSKKKREDTKPLAFFIFLKIVWVIWGLCITILILEFFLLLYFTIFYVLNFSCKKCYCQFSRDWIEPVVHFG